MYGFSMSAAARFGECFTHRGMGMNGAMDFIHSRFHVHSNPYSVIIQ